MRMSLGFGHLGVKVNNLLVFSVADPWHFGVDPDPQIHASD